MAGKGKGKRVPRKGKKSRAPRSLGLLKSNCAQCTITYPQIAMASNTVYAIRNISLSNAIRAQTIAQAYQYYRIRKVWFKFKPLYDTFGNNSTGSVSVPYLYTMIDRTGTFSMQTDLPTLKNAGAKPRRFDDKTLTVSFKPAIVIEGANAPGVGAAISQAPAVTKVSPWLTTNANAYQQQGVGPSSVWQPNTVDHMGLLFAVEQVTPVSPTAVVGYFELCVEFEFKKQLWEVPTSGTSMTVLDADTFANPPPAQQLSA